MGNVRVSERIAELMAERAERTRVTADRVLEEYAKLGFANMRDVAQWGDGWVRFTASDDMDEADAAAVKSITREEKFIPRPGEEPLRIVKTKLELHDKKGSLDSMARHLGMFDGKNAADGVELTVKVVHAQPPEK